MKIPHLSIYSKIVLAYLLTLIPLFSLSLAMNGFGANSVREEIANSMISKVHFYTNLLELEFGKVIQQQQEFVNDEVLGKLSIIADGMTDIERISSIALLQKRLSMLKNSSSYVDHASAYIPSFERKISSKDVISPLNSAEYEQLLVSRNRYESPFIFHDGRLFISVPYPDVAISNKRTPLFVVGVEISTAELRRALRQFVKEEDRGGAILVGDRSEWMIFNEDQADIAQQLLEYVRVHPPQSRESAKPESVVLNKQSYLVAYEQSSLLGTTLLTYVPEDTILGPLNKYRMWFWELSVTSAFIIAFFSYLIFRLIHQPLKKMVRAFNRIEKGDLNQTIKHRYKDEFRYLYDKFNEMIEKLNFLVHEVYEQKYRAQLSELRKLQSQINPHFLYNSFFIISRMAQFHEHDNVIRFTRYLSEYFQFMARDGSDEVLLRTEVKYAWIYAEIQQIRFSRRIRVEFPDLPDAYGDLSVPRLILQPIIENAYNHGLEDKLKDGLLRVSYQCTESQLIIVVEDNGEAMNADRLERLRLQLRLRYPWEEFAESTGMLNVHRRIQIKYGPDAGLMLAIGPLGGLQVRIAIPLPEDEGDHRA